MQSSDTEFCKMVAKSNDDFRKTIQERNYNNILKRTQKADVFIKTNKLVHVNLDENKYLLYYDGTRYFQGPDGKHSEVFI